MAMSSRVIVSIALGALLAAGGCLAEEDELGRAEQAGILDDGGDEGDEGDDIDPDDKSSSCSNPHRSCLYGSCSRPASGSARLFWDLATQFRPRWVISSEADYYRSYAFRKVLGFRARGYKLGGGSVNPHHGEFIRIDRSQSCGSGALGANGTCIEIRFAAAYTYDPGFGFLCPGPFCDRHRGDTEMVAVLLKNYSGTWKRIGTYFSAHHNAVDDECGVHISWPTTSRPTAYVANGKHANYRTDGQCDGGPDDCRNYLSGIGSAPLQDLNRYSLIEYPQDSCRSYNTANPFEGPFGEAGVYHRVLWGQSLFGYENGGGSSAGDEGEDGCAECL